jgi:hypothetical protein
MYMLCKCHFLPKTLQSKEQSMPNIRDLLLDRLLNEWLEKWKDEAPSRLVEQLEEGVPENWSNGLEEKVPENWLVQMQETRDAINNLFDDKDKYDELYRHLKKKYEWVDSMSVGNLWSSSANKGKELQLKIGPSWRDFLSQAVEILLEKTHRQWDHSEKDFLYPLIRLKIEALLDSLIYSVYKAELHGRTQPRSWEDFLAQAIELLLTGKRQWNRETYPDISEQIKSIVSSLVSTVYRQHMRVQEVYSDWAHKWRFLSSHSQREENGEDEEEGVEYTSSEFEEILKKVSEERAESLVEREQNFDFISGFDLGDDPELCWFAERLPEFIEAKRPHRHRINVVLKSNSEIANELGLSVKKVQELKKKLKQKLQLHKDNLLGSS